MRDSTDKTSLSPVSEEEFKDALAQFATGVAVMTTRTDDQDVAMTATSFTSVSLDPPLVLISVGQESRMHEALRASALWAVSILSQDMAYVASRFAIRNRLNDWLLFEDLRRHRGQASGAFVLDDSLATLECRTVQWIPAGDHTLVVGEVVATGDGNTHTRPLLYYRSRYRVIRDMSTPD